MGEIVRKAEGRNWVKKLGNLERNSKGGED